MQAIQPIDPKPMTEADYLAYDDAQELKHEYVRGYVYAMSGGSLRHSIIIANTITQLNNRIGRDDCTVTSSDIRVHIAAKQSYRYPDVTVFYGDANFVEGRADTMTNPVVLVEVLSPSTALLDRNDKLKEYTQLPSLQAYLLISQNEAHVERFMRHDADQWLYQSITGLHRAVAIPALDCTLPLKDLYNRVQWDDA